jgi:hypothetical protein
MIIQTPLVATQQLHEQFLMFLVQKPHASRDEFDLALAQRASTSMWTGNDKENTKIVKNDLVKALYSWDSMWYEAKVIKKMSRGRYQVVFDGYTEREIVHVDDMERIPTAAELQRIEANDQVKRDEAINYVPSDQRITLLHHICELGTTSHSYAANRKSYAHVAKWLLTNNALISAKDRSGFTPLHRASAGGYLDLVMLLLDWGAQWRTRTVVGKQGCYDLARYNGHVALVQFFEEKTETQRDVELQNHHWKEFERKRKEWKEQ